METTMLREAFTDEHRTNVCRIGQRAACCRYLTVGPDGWGCEKQTSLRRVLDARVAQMSAQGDNCEGVDLMRQAAP